MCDLGPARSAEMAMGDGHSNTGTKTGDGDCLRHKVRLFGTALSQSILDGQDRNTR